MGEDTVRNISLLGFIVDIIVGWTVGWNSDNRDNSWVVNSTGVDLAVIKDDDNEDVD